MFAAFECPQVPGKLKLIFNRPTSIIPQGELFDGSKWADFLQTIPHPTNMRNLQIFLLFLLSSLCLSRHRHAL